MRALLTCFKQSEFFEHKGLGWFKQKISINFVTEQLSSILILLTMQAEHFIHRNSPCIHSKIHSYSKKVSSLHESRSSFRHSLNWFEKSPKILFSLRTYTFTIFHSDKCFSKSSSSFFSKSNFFSSHSNPIKLLFAFCKRSNIHTNACKLQSLFS